MAANAPSNARSHTFDWICLEVLAALLLLAPAWVFAASPVYLILQLVVYPDRYRTRNGSLMTAYVLFGLITVSVVVLAVAAILRGEKPF